MDSKKLEGKFTNCDATVETLVKVERLKMDQLDIKQMMVVRPAQEKDSEAAVGLIYSAGPKALEHGFSHDDHTAFDFLKFAFKDGRGFFGWRNHIVVVAKDQVALQMISLRKDEVIGIGAFYSIHDYRKLSFGLVQQVCRFYRSAKVPRVLWRALQLKTLMPPPERDMMYVANLGIRSDLRGLGIGRFFLNHQEAAARRLGWQTVGLDVFVDNPRGQRLYEKIGFVVTREQRFAGPDGCVPDSRRMEKHIVMIPVVNR